MEETTSTLHLYGSLAELVGAREVPLATETVQEMLHALGTQLPEVVEMLKSGEWILVNGPLDGGISLSTDELNIIAASEVHLLPATAGGSGQGMVLMGAALVASAFFPPMAAFAPALMGAGAGMMVGGLAQMLVKVPKTGTTSSSSDDNASYIFGDTASTTQQGKCLPVTYGIDTVDPINVSTSLTAEDYVAS